MTYYATRFSRTYTKELQFKLNHVLKIQLVEDGLYGRRTKEAVMMFQRNNKLIVDGKCGTSTWKKLNQVFYNSYIGYLKLRRFSSDVYLFISIVEPELEFGEEGEREYLSEMADGYEWITNAEYFDFTDPKSEEIDNKYYMDFGLFGGRTTVGVGLSELYNEYFDRIVSGSWAVTIAGMHYDGSTKFNVYNFPNLYPNSRQPRTLIGNLKNGNYVSIVIDGRRASSPGATLAHCIELSEELWCDNLVNLDGGGSTEAIYDGVIVNRPSDGRERRIGTAVGFLE